MNVWPKKSAKQNVLVSIFFPAKQWPQGAQSTFPAMKKTEGHFDTVQETELPQE